MLARDVRLSIGSLQGPPTLFTMAAVCRPPCCVQRRGRGGTGCSLWEDSGLPRKALIQELRADAAVVFGSSVRGL